MEQRLKISEITVGERHRKNMGDLKGLAHSIKKLGLLQAVGVTKDGHKLIFGERRLRATEMNGDDAIDCRVLDIKDILEAEQAENEYRETLTLSEKHALAEELLRQMPKGKRGNPTGANQHTGRNSRQVGGNSSRHGQETGAKIAIKAGFTGTQEMHRVKGVMKKGTPELQQAMDAGRVTPSTALKVAIGLPPDKQVEWVRQHVENGKKKPKTPKPISDNSDKSQAKLFEERMHKVLERVWGVEKQFGGVQGMMESVLWTTSTAAEKRRCIQTVCEAAEELAKFAAEMRAYGETHLNWTWKGVSANGKGKTTQHRSRSR